MEAVQAAFGVFSLGDLSYGDFDVVVNAETGIQMPAGDGIEAALSSSEDDDVDGGDDQGVNELIQNAIAASSSLETWIADFLDLQNPGASSPNGQEQTVAGALNKAQIQARADLITALVELADKWNKGILMLVQRSAVAFLSAPAQAHSARGAVARRALAFTQLYWTLLRIPGASSFGLFEPNVLRRTISVAKKYLEMACASSPSGPKQAQAPKPKPARKAEPAPAVEGSRRNPRREAVAKGASVDNMDADDDADMGEGEGGQAMAEHDDDEVEDVQRTKGGRNARRRKGEVGAAASDRHIAFTAGDIAAACTLLSSLRSLLTGFPLRSHQEFIPLIGQVLACTLTLPSHVLAGSAPAASHVASTLSFCAGVRSAFAHPLVLCATCVQALLDPTHASPLTTARILLKRIKAYLLHGHAGTSTAAAGLAAAGMEGPTGLDGETDLDGGAGACGIDLHRPALPPEPRTVRGRALYLTRVLVSDDLNGKVHILPSDADPSAVEPTPAHVLSRLPAVTALLQHLCMGAATCKADVRGVAADIVAHLRACLPHSLRRAFLRFLTRFGRSNKAGSRLLAVEVTGRLLGATDRYAASGTTESGAISLDAGTGSSSLLEGGSAVLSLALCELPRPSAADEVREGEGYGEEGAAYAGAEAHAAGEEEEGEGTAGDASPGAASVSTGRRSSLRRTSINMMGADNAAGTPVGSLRGATPRANTGRRSLGSRSHGASRGAGSPFYGRKSNGGAEHRVDASELEGGCTDPRPTVTALLDTLLRRASDKSPAVRARALSFLAEAVDPTAPHGRLLALLLTHLAYAQVLAAAAAVDSGSGAAGTTDVTLHDVSFGTSSHGPGAGVGAGNALSAALAAAALNASGVDLTTPVGHRSYAPSLPPGIQVLTPSGPSPLVPLLVRRMGDDKPAVRKAALHAAVALALSSAAGTGGLDIVHAIGLPVDGGVQGEGGGGWQTKAQAHDAVLKTAMILAARTFTTSYPASATLSGDDVPGTPVRTLGVWTLQHISARATDGSVLVRKAALSGLHALLMGQPRSTTLQHLWLGTVVPLVTDSETSVSSAAVEATRGAIIEPLLEWHRTQARLAKAGAKASAAGVGSSDHPVSVLPWLLLSTASVHEELCSCLSRAMGAMARPGGAMASKSAGAGTALPIDTLIAALSVAATALEPLDGAEGGTGPTAMDPDASFTRDHLGLGAEEVQVVTAAMYRRAAWLLLELLAQQCSGGGHMPGARLKVPAAGSGHPVGPTAVFGPITPFLVRSWGIMAKTLSSNDGCVGDEVEGDAARVLRVLSLVPTAVSPAHATALVDNVSSGLRSFTWAPSLVSAAVQAVSSLCTSHAPSQTSVGTRTGEWWGPLQARADEMLRGAAMPDAFQGKGVSEEEACKCLFTVGEAAMLGLDPDAGNGLEESRGGAGADAHVRRIVPVAISSKLMQLVQALMSPPVPSSSYAGLPESVHAHAVVALGKLCLRDQELAKTSLRVLVRDLHPTAGAPAAVRNNILFVLGDLCVRYTSLVDMQSKVMADAIADPAPLVRKHALVLLAQLVGSDYLKWRPHTFYRFASALADSDADVRLAAQAALTGPLLAKNAVLLQAHFVDLLFVLTGCTAHPAYAHLSTAAVHRGGPAGAARKGRAVGTFHSMEEEEEGEGEGGGLEGLLLPTVPTTPLLMPQPLHRLHVYRVLLTSMTLEARFAVHSKLAIEVLGAVLEGTLKLTPRDALLKSMSVGVSAAGGGGVIMALTPAAAAGTRSGEGVDELGGLPDGSGGTSALLTFPRGSSEALVAEVLAVLSSPDMRMGAGKGGAGDEGMDALGEEGGEGGTIMAASLAHAKAKVLAIMSRKQVVDNVVPVVVALKNVVQSARSPLLGPLMGYLAALMLDHGDGVRDALSADRSTFSELEYDLRMYKDGNLDTFGAGGFQAVQGQVSSGRSGGAPASAVKARGQSEGGPGGGTHPSSDAPPPTPTGRQGRGTLTSPPGSLGGAGLKVPTLSPPQPEGGTGKRGKGKAVGMGSEVGEGALDLSLALSLPLASGGGEWDVRVGGVPRGKATLTEEEGEEEEEATAKSAKTSATAAAGKGKGSKGRAAPPPPVEAMTDKSGRHKRGRKGT